MNFKNWGVSLGAGLTIGLSLAMLSVDEIYCLGIGLVVSAALLVVMASKPEESKVTTS